MDQQYVTAIDLQSGSNIWRTDRPKIIADSPEFMKSYSTPIVLSIDGARQAVVPGANWVCGYDVESGQEVWRAKYGFGYSVTPMAVFAQGNFVISTGYGESKFVAVKPGKGDVSDSIQWTARNAPAMSSFIVDSDIIYAVGDRPGTLRAIDAKTGKVLKKQRFLPNVSASILNAGGHLYIGSRDGIMKVVKCDPELEEVSKFDFGSPVYATPVVIENDLLVRTKDFMVRIGK
jgi:outer membrane protein assembly factor BamB